MWFCITYLFLFHFSQIGYISITANAVPHWRQLWTDPQTQLYHFIGKDNILFHTIYFPATLIGSGQGWILPHFISATHYLMFEGQKFSKSRNVGVFGTDAMSSKVESDVWRLALLRLRPETGDSDFTLKFLNETREWLRRNVANLSSRITKFLETQYGGVVPTGCTLDAAEMEVLENFIKTYHQAMDRVKLRDGVEVAMKVVNELNAYLNRVQFWVLEDSRSVMFTAVNMLASISVLWAPFTPHLAQGLREQLGSTYELEFQPDSILVPQGTQLPATKHLIEK